MSAPDAFRGGPVLLARGGPVLLTRGGPVLLAAALGALACGQEAAESRSAIAAQDAGYRIHYEATSPASPATPGRLVIRVETRNDWHVAPEAPVSLVLHAPAGLELDPALQRSGDALRSSGEMLEFGSDLHAERPGAALVRGSLKFGMCQGEAERCVIVRRELELPLEIAFR